MTCKDCIHYDICIFHYRGDENEKCPHFKNKANAVEVVRCKDCKHCHEYQKWNFDRYLGCNFNGEIYEVSPKHFCSFGERKEQK